MMKDVTWSIKDQYYSNQTQADGSLMRWSCTSWKKGQQLCRLAVIISSITTEHV